jgi:hypothetical protein
MARWRIAEEIGTGTHLISSVNQEFHAIAESPFRY